MLTYVEPTSFTVQKQKTADGHLLVDVVVAKVGILDFYYPDGKGKHVLVKEFIPEEELFNEDTIKTALALPFVHGHPTKNKEYVMLNGQNYGNKIKGAVSNPRREGDKLVATLRVYDSSIIQQLEKGERTEVSIGYRSRFDPESGYHNGEYYDGVQRDIKLNHLALVDKGRAGSEVRVLMNMRFNSLIKLIKKNKEEAEELYANAKDMDMDEDEKMNKDKKDDEMMNADDGMKKMYSEMKKMYSEMKDMMKYMKKNAGDYKDKEKENTEDKDKEKMNSIDEISMVRDDILKSAVNQSVRVNEITRKACEILGNQAKFYTNSGFDTKEVMSQAIVKQGILTANEIERYNSDQLEAAFDIAYATKLEEKRRSLSGHNLPPSSEEIRMNEAALGNKPFYAALNRG